MWVVMTKEFKKYGRKPEYKKREFESKEEANQCFQNLVSIGKLPEIYESKKQSNK